jgi:hypothetical protein
VSSNPDIPQGSASHQSPSCQWTYLIVCMGHLVTPEWTRQSKCIATATSHASRNRDPCDSSPPQRETDEPVAETRFTPSRDSIEDWRKQANAI